MKKIEFEPATTGKSGDKIKSKYTVDGSFPRRGIDLPCPRTVGELKALLDQIPDKLPIKSPFENGTRPVWCNISQPDEHLQFEEPW